MTIRIPTLLAVATLIVLLGFPKAGFYVQNIPVTFGYLLLGLLAVFQLVAAAVNGGRRLERTAAWLAAILAALAVVELFSFKMHGAKSLGVAVGILVSTIAMPVLAILATRWMLRTLGIERFLQTLRWALVPVCLFGLVSFLAYNAGGKLIGIPFVTTTGADISHIADRHNLRGPIIKMFSTYNNGNILGINLLLWGPLAAYGSLRAAAGYRSICILTLSRSVWVGLFALEFLGAFLDKSVARAYRTLGGVALLMGVVIVASAAIGKDPASFLLDRNLGGRVTNLQNDLEVISTQRIGWDSESLYAAALLAFGPIGAGLLTAAWVLPIVLGGTSEIQRTARLSLLVYMLIAVVEGAFTLVPTQAIYWIVAGIAMAPREFFAPLEQRHAELIEVVGPARQESHPARIGMPSRQPSLVSQGSLASRASRIQPARPALRSTPKPAEASTF